MTNETQILREALTTTVAVLSEALDRTGSNATQGPVTGQAIDRDGYQGMSGRRHVGEVRTSGGDCEAPIPDITVRSVFERINLLSEFAVSLERNLTGTHEVALRVSASARGSRGSISPSALANGEGVKKRAPEGYLEAIDELLQDVMERISKCQSTNMHTQIVLDRLEEATSPISKA